MDESQAFKAAVDNFLMREFGQKCTWQAIESLLGNNGFKLLCVHPAGFPQAYAQRLPWARNFMEKLENLLYVDLGLYSMVLQVSQCKVAIATGRPDAMLAVIIGWFEKKFPALEFRVTYRPKKDDEDGVVIQMICSAKSTGDDNGT